jgi:hypothetical protein
MTRLGFKRLKPVLVNNETNPGVGLYFVVDLISNRVGPAIRSVNML